MKINKYWETPVKKTKRFNKTYKGKMTKRRQAKLNKELLIVFTIWIISILIVALFTNSSTINDPVDVIETPAEIVDDKGGAGSIEVIDFVKTPAPKLSVEQQIRNIAYGQDFQWTDYLVRLAKCESTLNPNATNAKGNYPAGSVDRGIFQVNDYWHSEVSDKCAFDIRCATIWTMERINAGYQHEWACNKLVLK